MTYQEYLIERQKRVNELPIRWAFGVKQFDEMLKEMNATPDQVYSIGGGGFVKKDDWPIVEAFFSRNDQLPELMKDYGFAKGAIYYEMCNHEYAINWQRNWDVLNCFAEEELPYLDDDYEENEALNKYFEILKWHDKSTIYAFWDARKKYYHDAEVNEWF